MKILFNSNLIYLFNNNRIFYLNLYTHKQFEEIKLNKIKPKDIALLNKQLLIIYNNNLYIDKLTLPLPFVPQQILSKEKHILIKSNKELYYSNSKDLHFIPILIPSSTQNQKIFLSQEQILINQDNNIYQTNIDKITKSKPKLIQLNLNIKKLQALKNKILILTNTNEMYEYVNNTLNLLHKDILDFQYDNDNTIIVQPNKIILHTNKNTKIIERTTPKQVKLYYNNILLQYEDTLEYIGILGNRIINLPKI